MTRILKSLAALCLISASPAWAADAPARTEAEILKSVKLPEGYAATVFAMPPQGGYPTSVSAAIDGTIFVAIDENGSLGRDRNEPNRARGKVVRMRDTNGDGKADEFKDFAVMESPRGVIWDGPSGTAPGTLYVMSPPKLTAFTDTDGDGKADQQEDLLTGLGFDLGFRGADHTTNGCRLAIDGFIYIAVGDYGFTKAVAKDGTTLSMRGGGIVRIRPDGTGFEVVSRGQRNIYDVAVSPTLDLFTRDNTNDGGGWNVRLSFVPPGAHLGYPHLFQNFPEDIFQPLADLGGGSPCGALWVDEPGLPKGLFTVEWGAGGIMYHDDLVPDGAGWKVGEPASNADPDSKHKRPPVKQNKWIAMTRPTDMDADASGALFITSWEGATFNYNGPNAGYVLRVVKKDAAKVEVPDLGKATLGELVKHVASTSASLRQAAQREFLRRDIDYDHNASHAEAVLELNGPIFAESGSVGARVAALETSVQHRSALHCDAPGERIRLTTEAVSFISIDAVDVNEWIVRIAGNHPALFPDETLRSELNSKIPRVRAAAITTLRRLGKADAAPNILPLVADADPIVSHLAVRALSELKASEACLDSLYSADEKVKPGALRALYGIYEPAVVDGLIERLRVASGELRRGILNALCRLANQDAPYEDPKVWWGTRPDTSGPVYQPIAWSETPKIEAALKRALDTSSPDDAKWLVARMHLTKVNIPGLIELMLSKAGNDSAAKLTAIEGMFKPDNSLPPEALSALQVIALDARDAPDSRATALRLLARASERGAALDAVMAAFAPLAGHDITQPALTAAFEDFTRDAKNTKHLGPLRKLALGEDAARRSLAQTILVNLATSSLVKEKNHDAAAEAVGKCWAQPATAASLLGVIARTKAKALADQVRAHLKDPNNAVAEAALFAYQALGLNDSGAPMQQIAGMKYEAVFAAVQKGGDAKAGHEIYLRAGCIACHTITPDEPVKGPVLSAAAKIYDRAALTESILKPNAKIAQGFESQWFDTPKSGHVEGFVTREGGDSLDVRNIIGQTVTIEKGDIKERGKREISMMPEGLLNAFSPGELANLLAYLESLKAK